MKVEEFASLLFEIEVVSHVAHLQTTSFAQHMALNDLYTGMVDHRDAFIEAYQGEYGIISGYSTISCKEGTDIVKYLKGACESVEAFKATLTESYLQQLVDNISELLYTTKYKLVNLK
jgi:hypothetical protein